jgi:hypothetical protein
MPQSTIQTQLRLTAPPTTRKTRRRASARCSRATRSVWQAPPILIRRRLRPVTSRKTSAKRPSCPSFPLARPRACIYHLQQNSLVVVSHPGLAHTIRLAESYAHPYTPCPNRRVSSCCNKIRVVVVTISKVGALFQKKILPILCFEVRAISIEVIPTKLVEH